jgi:hypothetical protein
MIAPADNPQAGPRVLGHVPTMRKGLAHRSSAQACPSGHEVSSANQRGDRHVMADDGPQKVETEHVAVRIH